MEIDPGSSFYRSVFLLFLHIHLLYFCRLSFNILLDPQLESLDDILLI